MAESVWDYPRPPRVEPAGRRIRVVLDRRTIADTTAACRVLETSHPPVYYVPRTDVSAGLTPSARRGSLCEWKGAARYWDVSVGGRVVEGAAWGYPDPSPGYESLRDTLAFYPALMDECWVDEERATPQPGGFYGGWVTSDLIGPFKGGPGTSGW